MMTDTQTMSDHVRPSADHPQTTEPLSLGGDLPEGIQTRNDGLLSLKDIEARLGVNYSRLQRFANVEGMGEYLGAVSVPGAKGMRYEPRAVEVFRRVIAASDAKELTPATAVTWLKLHEDAQPSSPMETAITEKPLSGHSLSSGHSNDLMTRGLMTVLAPVVSIMQEVRDLLHDFKSGRAQIAPAPAAAPQPDRLLTAEQAAEILACKPGTVSRRVPPVLRGRYRESDVLRYIEQLEPIAKK